VLVAGDPPRDGTILPRVVVRAQGRPPDNADI
jgi:hypothetical protein